MRNKIAHHCESHIFGIKQSFGGLLRSFLSRNYGSFSVIAIMLRNLSLLKQKDSRFRGNDNALNYFLIGLTLIILSSCDGDKKEKLPIETIPIEQLENINIPTFNSDSAFYHIEKQVGFGPRVPNTPAHEKAATYIEEKLTSFGLNVIVQKAEVTAFDNKVLKIKNIIGELNPEASKRILLFTHWDTRPFADQDTHDQNKPIDGANDGGSGTGVLLEIARIISKTPPDIGVDFIFFDAEDYGQPDGMMADRKPDTYCLGSQYWARNLHKPNYKPEYGILLDMVGASDAIFPKEGNSVTYAPHVLEKVWNTASRLGYSNYFINRNSSAITDDHFYVNTIAKIPSIDIIHLNANGGFGSTWHTHNDNISVIDKTTLKAVGQTLLDVIYREK